MTNQNSNMMRGKMVGGVRTYMSPVDAITNNEKIVDNPIRQLHGYAPHSHRVFDFVHDVSLPSDQSKLEMAKGELYDRALEEIARTESGLIANHRKEGNDAFILTRGIYGISAHTQYTGIKPDKSTILPDTSGHLRDGAYKAVMITMHVPYTVVPCKPKADL